jgi:hypothetical protein
MGIGGESTGWALELESATTIDGKQVTSIQVSYRKKGKLEKLQNKRVKATGKLAHQHGVETGELPVLDIFSIKETEATAKPAPAQPVSFSLSNSEWLLEDLGGRGALDNVAKDLHELMQSLGHRRYRVVGHDLFWGVGTEPGRSSGVISFSRTNLQIFSRFSRFDPDFSIAAVRREICGLIGNSVPAAQLLSDFDEGFCHLLWIFGKQYSSSGVLCQLAKVRITLNGVWISQTQGRWEVRADGIDSDFGFLSGIDSLLQTDYTSISLAVRQNYQYPRYHVRLRPMLHCLASGTDCVVECGPSSDG